MRGYKLNDLTMELTMERYCERNVSCEEWYRVLAVGDDAIGCARELAS